MNRPGSITLRLLAGLALILLPSPSLLGNGEVLARVRALVVDGQRLEEVSAEQAEVIRTSGASEAAAAGLELFADDEVRTGAGVEAVLFYSEEVATTDREVTVFENSRVTIRGPTSILLRLGGLFARLRGLFDVEFEEVLLGAAGTEFQLVASGGEAELTVLEGAVTPRGRAPGLQLHDGGPQTLGLPLALTNACGHDHEFEVQAQGEPRWVESRAGGPYRLAGGESRIVLIELAADTTGVASGSYAVPLNVRCLDCRNEPTCDQASDNRITYTVTVTSSSSRVQALQKLRLASGGMATEAAGEPEVTAVLEKTNETFLALQPQTPFGDWTPHFDSPGERAAVFRESRYRAIWQQDAEAWERLGDVYSDWGEATRTLGAYEKQLRMNPDRQSDPAWLVKLAESAREVGELELAWDLLERAEAGGASGADFQQLLGNLASDLSEVAAEREEPNLAQTWLELAAEAFQSSVEQARTPRQQAVAHTSLAESLLSLGDLEASGAQQRERYEQALSESRRARELYPSYLYSLAREGQALQKLGRSGQSEEAYRQALERDRGFAPAHYLLGRLYEEEGRGDREEALESYRRAIRSHPKYAPPYFRAGRLLESESPERASPYFQGFLALERQPFREGAKSREASRVILQARDRSDEPRGETLTRREPVAVPDLKKLSRRAAEQRLSLAGLRVGRITEKESNKEPGSVLEHEPKKGKRVEPGSAVDLVVAIPKVRRVRVPDLTGRDQRQAEEQLRRQGLSVGSVRQQPACQPQGTVLEQAPPRGTRVTVPSEVSLVVAGGGRTVTVPRLQGLSFAEAQRALAGAGLKLGRAERREDSRPRDTVLDQEPGPGTQLTAGCPVNLALSAGIELVVVPNLTGLTPRQAEQALVRQTRGRLQLGRVLSSPATARTRPGTVFWQSVQPGARVKPGTRIDVRYAQEVQLVVVPDVQGRSSSDAAAILRRAGLNASFQGQGEYVSRQTPSAGARVPRGSTVTLVLVIG